MLSAPGGKQESTSNAKRQSRHGVTAVWLSLVSRYPTANVLEQGAEGVVIRDFLGHSQIASTERYAKVSRQKIKQEYLRTMQKILKQGQV